MDEHHGGCLCGGIRYLARGAPARVTVCHCRFCQRATGSAYLVEPVFKSEDFDVTTGEPATYSVRSAGSGKMVHIHFCATCGTKLYLSFERFPGAVGLYGGTFDDPHWFALGPDNSRHIFIDEARPDTVFPTGIPLYHEHAFGQDGSERVPVVKR